ncbi:hypothetical protein JCGZ_15847 [Jatropha curcas]|uniref:ATPase F1/V1/A1 complex alpha/beta subunit nucleotide-binding domain-containing protein n=1 Tax=Jatropha curcas TaxID=180498 RepID=A0A067LAA6_JATCU|nr:hypothetical protein JCGZ_15847 [Jatropha curcas]
MPNKRSRPQIEFLTTCWLYSYFLFSRERTVKHSVNDSKMTALRLGRGQRELIIGDRQTGKSFMQS